MKTPALIALSLVALSGCARGPYECWNSTDPATACPDAEMRTQEGIIVDAFEEACFDLTPEEAECVAGYYYHEAATLEELRADYCPPGAWSCSWFPNRWNWGEVDVFPDPDGDALLTASRKRHELLHLILHCTGVPDAGGHSHPTFRYVLPAWLDASVENIRTKSEGCPRTWTPADISTGG